MVRQVEDRRTITNMAVRLTWCGTHVRLLFLVILLTICRPVTWLAQDISVAVKRRTVISVNFMVIFGRVFAVL